MMTRNAVAVVLLFCVGWSPMVAAGMQRESAARRQVQVEMVHTIGCVERRNDPDLPWWLTRAAEPTVTRPGVFNSDQVAEISAGALGTGQFQLVGVADFLTAEGLLGTADRALFTAPDQVNATGELRDGRTVLVKGLLIERDGAPRINLVAVVGLEDKCR